MINELFTGTTFKLWHAIYKKDQASEIDAAITKATIPNKSQQQLRTQQLSSKKLISPTYQSL